MIVPGRIYIAPPDHHLIVSRATMRLDRGPRENGNRPAADPMFRSAARAFGPRMIGVVLTGNLDDGTSGLADIKRAGGIVVAQDPKEALFPSMPRSAIEHLQIDHVVAITDLARLLDTLTAIHLPRHGPAVDGHSKTNEMPAVLADRSSPSKNAARRAALAII